MSDMLRKKEVFTVVTPIPTFIPRQLAINILHAHSEVITLNPLVIGHHPISAPRNASADEFYSTWYEIEERIQYIPGAGKLGAGKISFNGCFHDMPWGLQTHIHAPMGIDLRNTYRICGNEPGEPPVTREIGLEALGAPLDGLYLREDIEIKCNITMVSFVKAQLKTAGKEMVRRIIKKAELIDAGVLKAMFEDGRLKTVNLNDRSAAGQVRANKFLEAQHQQHQHQQSQMYAAAAGSPSASPLIERVASVPPEYSPGGPMFANLAYTATPPPPLFHNQQRPQHQQQQEQQQQQMMNYQSALTPPPVPRKDYADAVELPGDDVYSPAAFSPDRNMNMSELLSARQQSLNAGRHRSVAGNTYAWRDEKSSFTTQRQSMQ